MSCAVSRLRCLERPQRNENGSKRGYEYQLTIAELQAKVKQSKAVQALLLPVEGGQSMAYA